MRFLQTKMNSKTKASARTCGDGMENVANKVALAESPLPSSSTFTGTKLQSLKVEIKPVASNVKIPGQDLIYRQSYATPTPPGVVPQGKIFNLIPRLVISKTTFSVHNRNRAPRFVPFEPYKAAINPIIPLKPKPIRPNRKNNLALNTLVSHMSTMKIKSLTAENATLPDTPETSNQTKHYKNQMDDLRKDRDCVAAQLKSQVQVNAELKKLLVAAVGEDLQTRVNVLTEDKLELARALISSAEHLSSHTEQIEFLAGQSEVWRSKFLASSLMVEELARWKASLCSKNTLLLESNKQLLQTLATLRDIGIETWTNLKFLCEQRDPNLQSSNVLDLSAESLNISQQLVLHSGIGMPQPFNLAGLDKTTPAEKNAVQALQHNTEPLMSTDEAFKAIVGQAFPFSGKRYPSHSTEINANN